MKKIALVGIGKIAVDQHVPSIATSPDWELAGTVSRHESVDGVEAYLDFETMLEARPDMQVVSLCMPPVPRFGAVRLIRTRLRLPFNQVFRSYQVGATRREPRRVRS